MNLEQKIKAQVKSLLNNLEKIKKWDARASALNKSNAAFCRDHNLSESYFIRVKNLNSPTLPKQKIIDEVEAAFKKEGV